ncbi:CaiB/BaiF CoA transferase family protein [Pseudonocardia sp. H11422]|uniref:CaiB/BaiF CoA transferase family protein n=1 Tax=Pseudonocardia sp. H11422 TaxID=2835866 RepID=UPI001BDC0238|nr:CoA transferase [Pseudonocardia sp. H11422]
MTGASAPTPITAPPGCLSGVRVLDLSSYLPGPFCTQILADLGASVIKVEGPGGDAARQLPGALHESANRNKRSVVLDLKTDRGQELGRRLAAGADVFVEGFRPGVVDRLGMSYSAVRAVNPSIVYCSVSGFGQTGPLRDVPGHDVTYLAASGVLSFPGSWGDRLPRRPGVPVSDLAASTYATVAILAALYQRRDTGEGAHLDLAITDAALAFASVRADANLDDQGTDHSHLHPANDLFEAADGVTIAIGAVEEHFWERLAAMLAEEVPALADPRFGSATARRAAGDELVTLLRRAVRARPATEWLAAFAAADIPAHRVLSVPEAGRSPHVRTRGIVADSAAGRHVVFPVLRDGAAMGRVHSPAPALGAHTEQVLTDLMAGKEPW